MCWALHYPQVEAMAVMPLFFRLFRCQVGQGRTVRVGYCMHVLHRTFAFQCVTTTERCRSTIEVGEFLQMGAMPRCQTLPQRLP